MKRFGQLLEQSITHFFRDGCTQRAAAISFYALFSMVPLAILSVAVLGLVANDTDVRAEVVDFVLDNVPLTQDQGRRELERLMLQVTRDVAGFGVLGTLTLVFAASNIMASIRQALNAAFNVEESRPPVQAKLWDLFGVVLFGLLVTVSFGLTLIDNVVQERIPVVSDVLDVAGELAPILVAVVLFAGIYRLVPAQRPRTKDIWPGVIVAAVGYELAKRGFTLYLSNFADYGAIYASLGSVIAFLVFVYVAALVALLGAEFAAEWPRVKRGDYDGPPGPPFSRQVLEFVKGLFVRRS